LAALVVSVSLELGGRGFGGVAYAAEEVADEDD
jgi:hypothetical protein